MFCFTSRISSKSDSVGTVRVWFVAPDMVDLLWVSAEVKWGSVVLCGFWLVRVKIKIPTSMMIFIAYVYKYNPTYAANANSRGQHGYVRMRFLLTTPTIYIYKAFWQNIESAYL